MDSLEEDMDQIRYDAGSTERALKIDSEAYASVQEQFRLTDYEEIKDLKRYRKKSFYWYQKVIHSNGTDLENNIDY